MRWIFQVFTTELRKAITYRIDFWLQFVMSIFAHVGAAYFLWKAIFDYKNVDTMEGYSFIGLMFYYVMVPLISRMVNGPGLGMIAQDIYDGALTRYLIYPVSFFTYKYVQYFTNILIFFAQLIIATLIFIAIFGKPDDTQISFASFLMGMGAVLCAGFMAFTLSVLLEMVAFWADNVWSILVMVRFCVSILGGAMIPVSFFPDKLESILSFMPFMYLASFPITTFLGKTDLYSWLTGIGIIAIWTLVFYLSAVLVWHRGKYKYTGVGI